MNQRQLPARVARQHCLNQLFADEDEFAPDIEEDDVAATSEPDYLSDVEDNVSVASDDTLEASVLSAFESDNEGSEVDDDDAEDIANTSELTSPDAYVWNQVPESIQGRVPRRNVFRERSGFRAGLHPRSRAEAFAVITASVLEETLRHTNKSGQILARARGVTWKKCSLEELQAFIALHFIAGAFKAHHRDARELFCARDGISLFRATMSHERFCQLKCALRFDDPHAAIAKTSWRQFVTSQI